MASLYIVLDLINDLVNPTGDLGQEVVRRDVLGRTAAALDAARAANVRVAYVRVAFTAGDREKPRCSPLLGGLHDAGYIALDGAGTQVHESVTPQPGDLDIVKHRVSPFYGTNLDLILRAHQITRLYVSGVSTSYAVSAAVREAHNRDLEIVLLEDCCAAGSEAEHDAEIEVLRALCGTVTTSDAVTFA